MTRTIPSSKVSPDDFVLPPFTRRVTTNSPEAKQWVEKGFIWSYGFNHAESARCFKEAIDLDPSCPLAYWGLAFALGPNYNKPWNHFDVDDRKKTVIECHQALVKGRELSVAEPVEKALIEALLHRFPEDGGERFSAATLNKKYAEAMAPVYAEFMHDLDVAVLYADALMNLTPWGLWDVRTGKPGPGSRVLETQVILEKVLASAEGSEHIGALHMYIHLTEMSSEPENGLAAAEKLRRLGNEVGHLTHMPSHLDILIGDYRNAVKANTAAVLADEKLANLRGGGGDFYTIYRMHDYHSLIYAAMFAGQYKVSMDAVNRMEAALPEETLHIQSPPMADWLETYWSVRPHVLIRFGRWDDILALELPADQVLFCVTAATIHYARGVAWAALGNVPEAERERELFLEAKKRVPRSRIDYPNKCSDVLGVAEAMLDGELEYRRGNVELAFEHLRKSIDRDDALVYAEPWAWMQPARHAYAALLMEQGRIEEAADVYRTDLGLNDKLYRARHHPNNVWALHGYYECATRLGLHGEAVIIKQQLKTAQAFADVPIESSCYCRRDVKEAGSPSCCSKI